MARDIPCTFFEAIQSAKQTLSQSRELVGKGLVETEAEQIVLAAYKKTTGKDLTRLELFSKSAEPFSRDAAHQVFLMSSHRAAGQPLQYLTGSQVFLDHTYVVAPGVLIPRPETEVLVTIAFEYLDTHKPSLGIEVGVGSGIISIELLNRYPELNMVGTEVSEPAKKIAVLNAQRILGGVNSQRLAINPPHHHGLPEATHQSADFIISNPPYLVASDPIEQDVLQHEPHEALFAPPRDPFYFYRAIAADGPALLRSGGMAFLELPSERALEIHKLFRNNGWNVEIKNDLTGRHRVLVAISGN